MKPSEIQFARSLEALSAPQSRRIVKALVDKPLSANELAKACKLSPVSIEKHLEPLIQSGVVSLTSSDESEAFELNRAVLQPTIDWFTALIL